MKGLAVDLEFEQGLVAKLASPEFLISIEGSERFDFADGSQKDMSEKRVRRVLGETLEDFRKQKYGQSYRPLGAKRKAGLISDIIAKALTHNVVTTAYDSMPGWGRGITEFNGERYLVRRNLDPVTPVKGPWDELRLFFESSFGVSNPDEPNGDIQLHAFYCLVLAKLRQLKGGAGDRGSCPLLVLIGEPNSGKSFLGLLLALLLGQQETTVDPSGECNGWTDALLSSPVLFYDEASRADYSFGDGMSRAKFAEEFKRMEYNSTASIATRGRRAQSLPVVWFWIRALNPDSHASILQTPVPTEGGMEDKLIITKFYRGELPLSGQESPEARKERLEILRNQLPHFAYYILNEFPKERKQELIMQSATAEYRNQAHPFAHPDLLELLQSSENDSMKKAISIDLLKAAMSEPQAFIGDDFNGDEFRASDLHRIAVANSAVRSSIPSDVEQAAEVFTRTFKSAESVGRILAQMADDPAEDRITCNRRSNCRFYSAHLPKSAGGGDGGVANLF